MDITTVYGTVILGSSPGRRTIVNRKIVLRFFIDFNRDENPRAPENTLVFLGKRSKRASMANLRLANYPKHSLRRRVPADAPRNRKN